MRFRSAAPEHGPRRRLTLVVAMLAALAIVVPGATMAGHKPPKPPKTTQIQILGLNDFHGQLEWGEPAASSGFRIGPLSSGTCNPPACYPAGGVEYLSTHVEMLRAENPRNTVFVSAGDLIGATPLLSAAFHDEPTIEAFNLMELDYNGVGNHEFDEGVDELLRMQNGGCHPVDGCYFPDEPYAGADFQWLSANVVNEAAGKATVVDIRDFRELYLKGKIPGAFHADRGMLEFWIDPASEYYRDVFRPDRRYVLYCAGGGRSALAARAMPHPTGKPCPSAARKRSSIGMGGSPRLARSARSRSNRARCSGALPSS